jgi:isopenicillin-N N-acyltransferase like protein
MTRHFRSSQLQPFSRGLEFGTAHKSQIETNIAIYFNMFKTRSGKSFDAILLGRDALFGIESFAPDLHQEILGMAQGAKVDSALIGMLNARTEILASLKAKTPGECSTVIHVSTDDHPPIAMQTWDWFYALKDSWLVWEIPLADGSVTTTMTEYGIVGKSGVNSRGLGVLFTILHHENDGGHIGVPVHVVSRHLLDTAPNISRAAQLAASTKVSASSSLNLVGFENGVSSAITVELYPDGPGFVLPNQHGFLIHTNHFIAPKPAEFDTEPKANPDTLLRYDLLTRRTSALKEITTASILKSMVSHAGSGESICCHRDPKAAPTAQYETLSTVIIDFASNALDVHNGGPCSHPLNT